ncbi:MAG: replication initiation protein [Saprospiraceae bacterium]
MKEYTINERAVFDERNKLVVKSNILIESKYNLSVREQKFLIYLASLTKKDDLEYRYTSIRIKDIEKALKMSDDKKWGSIYDVVREIVMGINKKPITIRKDNGGWTIINWFSAVDANPDSGLVTFELSNIIKKQLVALKEYFTKYKFGNILALNGGYSIRIYELLKMNQFKHKVTYDLEYFRELVGTSYKDAKGESIIKYPEYKAFKRSIIKYAQTELKKETDIYFELKEIREGRKVKSLVFYVFRNMPKKEQTNQTQLFVEDATIEEDTADDYNYNNEIIISFVEIGFTESTAKLLYKEGFNKIESEIIRKKIVTEGRSLDEYFKEKIEYVEFQLKKGAVGNPPGLLIKAIQEDYQNKELKAKSKRLKTKKKNEERKQLKKDKENELKELKGKLFEKELKIVQKLVTNKEGFLEELLEGEYPELWRGYNPNLSLMENFMEQSASNMTRYKIIDRVKKQYGNHFNKLGGLKVEIAEISQQIRRI